MGGVCQGEAGRRRYAASEVLDAPPWEYPMYILPMAELLQMNGPPRAHQLLLQEGKVVLWHRGRICIFISHQWLSFTHPDPEGKQLQVVRKALESLLSGALIVEVDAQLASVSAAEDLPRFDADEQEEIYEAFIWYDYFSIPQLNVEVPSLDEVERGEAVGIQVEHHGLRASRTGTATSQMAAAVASIPIYVGLSHYFVVVAPLLQHYNTKNICDFESWIKRGWCRLELWSHTLRQGLSRPMLLVRSEAWVQFKHPHQWYQWHVHQGLITVDSDRHVIKNMAEMMVRRKMEGLKIPRDSYEQFLAAIHGALVGKALPPMGDRAFQDRFGLESLGEDACKTKKWSLPSVTCAALAGQPDLVMRCLQARCNVDAPIAETALRNINIVKGMTALQCVCFCRPLRQQEVLHVLLEARANVEAQNSWGLRALHICTTSGAVDMLLHYGADLHSRAVPWGWSALYTCAGYHGNAATVQALIHHGGHVGNGLMAACIGHDDTDMVKLLLAHGAEADRSFRPKALVKWCGRVLVAYYGSQLQSASPLTRLSADMEGITPLGTAAISGKASIVRVLLDARASPEKGNWRGLTPMAFAGREGFPSLFSDLAAVADRSRGAQIGEAPPAALHQAETAEDMQGDLSDDDVDFSRIVDSL